ncbi:MAG: LamG domain-containing protein [Patescibacteria group bacterium]|nr:LamG domain-containing protein [Patescibacteria group bacterium]
MDGTDASTTFTDSETTPKTVTANGNAQIDTAQSKFGGASGLFDGTGDYLTLADNADWAFGSGAFTVDFWIKVNANPAAIATLLAQWPDAGGTQRSWDIALNPDGTIRVDVRIEPSTYSVNSVAAVNNGAWHHIAMVRNGDTLTLYIDGSASGTPASLATSGSLNDSTDSLYIAAYNLNPGLGYEFNGWLDELRISKGIARWTTNFTPPSAAYSATEAYTLAAAYSTFTLTGEASLFKIALKILAAYGSILLSGQTTLFKWGRKVAAAVGNFVLTGYSVALNYGKILTAAAASFTLTGQAASLVKALIMGAVNATFSLTGNLVTFLVNGMAILWTKQNKSADPTWTKQNKSADPTWTKQNKSADPTWTKQNRS